MRSLWSRLFGTPSAAPPDGWLDVLRRQLRPYPELDQSGRERLHDAARYLLARVHWEGCGGLQLDDEIRVTVAGHAALMTIGFGQRYRFPNLRAILVYPGGFLSDDHGGGRSHVLGEASRDKTVVVSWWREEADPQASTAAVVYHEFAHLFDFLDGAADGLPPLPEPAMRDTWPDAFRAELNRFLADEDRAGSVLTEYAASHPAEFFAMSSESFFHRPVQLERERPQLYELLATWYRQDPSGWYEDEPQAAAAAGAVPHAGVEAGPAEPEARCRDLEDYLRAHPDWASGWDELADCLVRLQRWERATQALTALVELRPREARAYHERGLCWLSRGRDDLALADFDRAIELEPDVGEGYVERARVAYERGQIDDALADVARALTVEPEHSWAIALRGWCRLARGDRDAAMRDFRQALALDDATASAAWGSAMRSPAPRTTRPRWPGSIGRATSTRPPRSNRRPSCWRCAPSSPNAAAPTDLTARLRATLKRS